MAAIGVLLALVLLLRTARIVGLNPNPLWNLCVVALFAALAGSRLVLLVLNWSLVRTYPAWLLGLAMVHHPLVAAIGVAFGLAVAVPYAHAQHLPRRSTADALAAPAALALACEQLGALLAGAGYGTETDVRWAVVYTSPFAMRWSGTPLFDPVHPVQAYAAGAFLVIAAVLVWWMTDERRPGDVAGVGLLSMGAATYLTEFFRDPEGRGELLGGAIDYPQLASIALIILGAFVLRDRNVPATPSQAPNSVAAEARRE
jgi:phosphatidylglycerol:prolipoprotein diacylglycerol transferase